MDYEPIGNSVSLEASGNVINLLLIDIATENFFLTTLQTLTEHKEVEIV